MTDSNVSIRRATEADRQAIVDTYVLSQEATGCPDPSTCPPQLLGDRLYERLAVRRYVAESMGRVVGHGLVELPNTAHIPTWISGTKRRPEQLLELGGAFVHPDFAGKGVWTKLLEHRLEYVRSLTKVAVAATWLQNDHVMRVFERYGAERVGQTATPNGNVVLYRFGQG